MGNKDKFSKISRKIIYNKEKEDIKVEKGEKWASYNDISNKKLSAGDERFSIYNRKIKGKQHKIRRRISKQIYFDKTSKKKIFEGTAIKNGSLVQLRLSITFFKGKGNRRQMRSVIGKSRYHRSLNYRNQWQEAFEQAYTQCPFSPSAYVIHETYFRYKI